MNYGAQVFLVVAVSVTFTISIVVVSRREFVMTGTRRIVQVTGVLVALVGMYAFWPLPETPAWEEPATEQERKARDFAHSIVLPDSVPKPVPFNFALARFKALVPGMPNVSEQYFKHLCDTEAGQYIFKTVENVDGFLQMRPRRQYTDIEQMNPYILESAVGIFSSSNQRYKSSVPRNGAPVYFVQPMNGSYQFLEQPSLDRPGFSRFYRGSPVINSESSGVTRTFDLGKNRPVEVYFVVNEKAEKYSESKYAYTWRGVRRQNDRAYWISGGELIVIDTRINEILAVYRDFNMGQGKYFRWNTSRACGTGQAEYDHLFVPKVLKPNPLVNENVQVLKVF